MANTLATLSAGTKSLVLTLSIPTDWNNTKPRNDITTVMVWYSTTAGFTPGSSNFGFSVPFGASITITGLLDNTTYYVRYAFVSSIDSSVYTYSKEYSQTTLSATQGPPGATGSAGPLVDISGVTTFYKNSAGVITPSTATLSAVTQNITSPTYSWTVSGATPTSGTSSSITITPNGVGGITVSLTVNGSNLTNAVTVSKTMVIVDQGIQGQTGARGIMSAYPSIYQWLPTGTTPTRPTSAGTYTWATGSYGQTTSTTGTWYTEAPSNTTKGYTLWQITVPLTVTGDTTQSTLDWTSTSYAMRAIAVNGSDGGTGPTGSSGSATYLINRGTINDSQAPIITTIPLVNEPYAAIGRNPVVGDIATILYNNGNNSTAYRCTAVTGSTYTWALQTSYITGSLIVENSIAASKITAGTIKTSDNTFNITIGDAKSTVPSQSYALINGINIERRNDTASIVNVSQIVAGFGYEIITLGDTTWPGYNITGTTKWFVATGSLTGSGTVRKLPGYGLYINDTAYFGTSGFFSNFQPGLEVYSKYGSTARFESDAYDNSISGVTTVTITGGTSTGLSVSGRYTNSAITGYDNTNTVAKFTGGGSSPVVIITSAGINQQAILGIGLKVDAGTSTVAAVDITNNAGNSAPAINAIGIIRTTGNVIAYYSDDRLKTKLGTITNALEKLNTLSGFYYEPNEVAQKLGYEKRREVGVSAQEVLKILPEIIHSAPVDNQYLTVDYERLIPLIIEAIKELDRRTK